MPAVYYKSGIVAPDGYEETLSGYVCDFAGCELEADYGNFSSGPAYCEEHWFEITKIETLPHAVWCKCGHISGQHGADFPHPCATGGNDPCDCDGFVPQESEAL